MKKNRRHVFLSLIALSIGGMFLTSVSAEAQIARVIFDIGKSIYQRYKMEQVFSQRDQVLTELGGSNAALGTVMTKEDGMQKLKQLNYKVLQEYEGMYDLVNKLNPGITGLQDLKDMVAYGRAIHMAYTSISNHLSSISDLPVEQKIAIGRQLINVSSQAEHLFFNRMEAVSNADFVASQSDFSGDATLQMTDGERLNLIIQTKQELKKLYHTLIYLKQKIEYYSRQNAKDKEYEQRMISLIYLS